MWRELLKALENRPQYEGFPLEFREPATPEYTAAVEQVLGVKFPGDFRMLLNETNGVYERFGDGDQQAWIHPLDQIEGIKLYYRADAFCAETYMPFENLLFFGSPGTDEIRFAFSITATGKAKDDIFVWWPQDDSRKWLASDLNDFLNRWMTQELDV